MRKAMLSSYEEYVRGEDILGRPFFQPTEIPYTYLFSTYFVDHETDEQGLEDFFEDGNPF